MIAAVRSSPEWTASEMTLTDCIMIPAASLMTINIELEITESAAALDFSS
jgi:hypothetical protein